MVKMIATKPHTFGGKVIQAGEEFEAEEQYAATLASLGRATRKDQPSTKTKPTTTKSEKPAEEPAQDDNGKKYKTRRVKAEDE